MTMGSKLLLFMLLGMTAAHEYYLDIQTMNSEYAGTDGPVYFELEGTDKRTFNFGAVKDLERSTLQHFSKQSDVNIGTIECISFKMGTGDAWKPDYMAAWSSYDHEKAYVYSRKTQYSTDPNKGPNHAKLCREGDTTYTITATTGTKRYDDTDNIGASVEIEGSKGNTETGIMDNPHEDDFRKGQTDKFVFSGMHNVGSIQCIVVKARGDDMWRFTKITVENLGGCEGPVTFHNTAETKLSTDTNEGVSSLKLCDN